MLDMQTDSNPLNESAFFPILYGGYLYIEGEHQVSFLQRQTTNDIRMLSPGGCMISVLTSPAGRILDVLSVLNGGKTQSGGSGSQGLNLVTLPGRGRTTTTYLKSHIFFMDKVTVEDRSQDFIQIEVFGLQVESQFRTLGYPRLPAEGEVLSVEGENPGLIYKTQGTIGLGFRIIASAVQGEWWISSLRRAGATQLDWPEFNLLRVEVGIPWVEAELNEDYTPLETNLVGAISYSKGCYTGQEVIARQTTYDKVTQHLCGLRLEKRVEPGARLLAEGKRVGKVTSVAESSRFGWIALAMIKRPYHQPGSVLDVATDSGEPVRAQTVTLPFSKA